MASRFAAAGSEMMFELSVTHNGVTIQMTAQNAPDLRELNSFLNSLTDKAIQKVAPTVAKKKRGRPAGSRNKAK